MSAQFLLKLPPSYSRRLASLAPSTPRSFAVPAPVIASRPRASRSFLAAIAGAAVAVAIALGVGGAFAQSSGGPVGVSKRAPKALDHVVVAPLRQTGIAHVVTAHVRAKHKR